MFSFSLTTLSITVLTIFNRLSIVLTCEDCEEFSVFEDVNTNSVPPPPVNLLGITLPGTKWCGPGDSANSQKDLGQMKDIDKCCRAHDNCPDIIEAKDTKHGLTNPDIFTRLHCNCEHAFQNCLRKTNSFTANLIGNTYTTARQYCYKFEYPIRKCIKYQEGLILKRCIKYKLDKKQSKQWQWFDIPFYS